MDLRTANGAGVGLGMKAPIQWIIVFSMAGRAHWEDAHRCLVTVIRDILDNGEARATVGAVDERIAIAPVRGIEEFLQTVITGGSIRRNERLAFAARLTLSDGK